MLKIEKERAHTKRGSFLFTKNYWLNLNPNQTPIMPPSALKITEETEKTPAPHNVGRKLPTAEPTKKPNQTNERVFI